MVNLATGLGDDAERVTVAFLVGNAAAESGRQVTMFLTKDAVRLALPGEAQGVACDGCPPLERLFEQYARQRRRAARLSDLLQARGLEGSELVADASIGGATPLWEWIGEGATVFSY